MGKRPVLCAFDASEPSLVAAHVAARLAGALCAPLELVYVVDHDELPALARSGAAAVPQVREALYEIQERVAEQAARAELEATLAELSGADVAGSVLTGAPAPVIRGRAIDRAAARDGDGGAPRAGAPPARQRGPLRGRLFGSVSTGLVRSAGRPVMLASEHAGST